MTIDEQRKAQAEAMKARLQLDGSGASVHTRNKAGFYLLWFAGDNWKNDYQPERFDRLHSACESGLTTGDWRAVSAILDRLF